MITHLKKINENQVKGLKEKRKKIISLYGFGKNFFILLENNLIEESDS